MKTILIIGGDSFIGSNFISKFYDKYNFKIISRVKKGFKDEIIVDDFFKLEDIVFSGVDILINFAAIVHRTNYIPKINYKKINYDLPVFLYEKSIKNGIKHFIQMSTIAVYERNEIINVNSIEKPNSFYGYYKLMTDNFLIDNSNNGIITTCIRPPMVYGGISPGNMLRLVKLAKFRFPLPFKNIDNRLTFINIFNLIDFINIVIIKKLDKILIPTDKKETSTREIIEIVREHLNYKKNLFNLPFLGHCIIKLFFPNLYSKLFKSMIVQCNLSDELYRPKHDIISGIKLTLSKMKL